MPSDRASPTATDAPVESRARGTLGTFGGVFTPSILTILGLILFLRVGYVVGAAGLAQALAIIALANGVSLLTSTSLAAAATNIRVKGGGVYYLISRTLGVEFGGSLGLVIYLAMSVSIAFYAIGFAEAVVDLAGGGPAWVHQVVALAAMLLLFVFAWVGADAATKLQYVIMASLALALIALFVGGWRSFDSEVLSQNWRPAADVPFWTLFAIFFPAVTGFTQGVAMSGDLRTPSISITRGTFWAVYISAAIYFGLAVLMAGVIPGKTLVDDYGAVRGMAAVPWLVDVGVVAATLSSALASLMGAPRILQSIAADRVFPILKPFAAGSGESNNPRAALIMSTVIGVAVVGMGDLNVVAPVVSMFFLISYGLLNYATYAEARGNSPNFRPRFRWYHRRLSLLGCLACLGAMVAIHPTAGAIALVLLFAMYQYLSARAGNGRWADSSKSHRLAAVRENLLAAGSGFEHSRDWRPVILAFSDDPARRQRILRFASWVEAGTGFTTAVRMIVGSDARVRKQRADAEAELRAEIQRSELQAFALVLAMPDLDTGFPVLVQGHGLGPVRANLILLNWFDGDSVDSDKRLRSYGRPLQAAVRLQRSVVILEATHDELAHLDERPPRERRIDVWFRNDATSRLMLLLAHLMTRHPEWSGADVRLLAALADGEDRHALAEQLATTLEDWRIEARVEIVSEPRHAEIAFRSKDAAAVILPFQLRGEVPVSPYSDDLEGLLDQLPMTVLVLAGQDIDLDAEPESGAYAAAAQAADAAEEKAQRATAFSKEAEQLARVASAASEKLERARAKKKDPEDVAALERESVTARDEAEWARRRALKAMALANVAEREAAEKSGEFTAPDPMELESEAVDPDSSDSPAGKDGAATS